MHDYSVRNESKKIAYYWISAISILITPVLVGLLEKLLTKVPILNELYQQISLLGFSISSVLIFTLIWLLFSKIGWKILAKIRVGKIPDISGTWICNGEGKKYSDSNDINNWNGIIQIEQEYEKLSVKLTTEESKSHSYSLVGDIEVRDKNEIILSYMYENEPFKTEEGLTQHKGFCRLIFDLQNKTANGRYYTDNDRSSYGTMSLKKQEGK